MTKNGYDEMHCLSIREYNQLQEEAAKAKLLSRIMLAEEEIAEEGYDSYDDFASSIRREYGLEISMLRMSSIKHRIMRA